MRRLYYDLHIHSALSPCADDDNTPNNILGMASLAGIDILALTDHNTAKNCPAFFAAAEKFGITAIAGMELTTSEDIHVVCLFEHLEDALRFDGELDAYRTRVANRPEIFGRQLIMDEEDEITGELPDLLSFATAISIEDVGRIVGSFGGVCYPAHIDRESNGIIATLGTFPKSIGFTMAELHDGSRIGEYAERYGLTDLRFIVSSDAHYLTDIRDKEHFFELPASAVTPDEIRRELFILLRRDNEGTIPEHT
ncbi:MAG: PHP domain-containing protein [Clostridia bacterium]|nr:PHP domain-containing protein [Clostridia bacterium]